MTRPFVPMLLLATIMGWSSGCGDDGGGGTAPDCQLPPEMPADAVLPDGGVLVLYQKATGTITGDETDRFTFTVDCRPGYGVSIVVRVPYDSRDLDIAYSTDVAGQHFDSNDWGPGEAEFGTLVTGRVSFPLHFVVDVWAANDVTGDYEIEITPSPMPRE